MDNGIRGKLAELNELFGQPAQSREQGVFLNSGAVVGLIGIIVAIIGISVGASIGYVNASRVHDLQREIDALKNRVDIAEAYINNLNQRAK